ncbi:MAG: hypothetical protein HC784_04265 [Hydrococcus sp. CSU_1_8]|nr:hypothetical protein [Hydrococcus sp. CSU_1_8]
MNYSDKRIGIVLTPCIFYEFNQRKIPDNSKSFNSSLDNCFSLLNEFGVKELFSFGLDNYKIARLNLKNICHDEKEILKLIQKLKKKKNEFLNFYQKFSGNTKNSKDSKIELFNPPFIIAFQLVAQQRINLKYFDRNIEI